MVEYIADKVNGGQTEKDLEFVSGSVDYSFGKWCGGQAATWLFSC